MVAVVLLLPRRPAESLSNGLEAALLLLPLRLPKLCRTVASRRDEPLFQLLLVPLILLLDAGQVAIRDALQNGQALIGIR